MSEIEALRKQVAALTTRLDYFERHHVKAPTPSTEPKPNGALTSRLDVAYERAKPRHQRSLVGAINQRYAQLAANLSNRSGDIDLAAIPRQCAALLTRETFIAQDLAGAQQCQEAGSDNEHRIARLEVELAALRRHTDDLVASTQLPPVPEELAAVIGKRPKGHERRY